MASLPLLLIPEVEPPAPARPNGHSIPSIPRERPRTETDQRSNLVALELQAIRREMMSIRSEVAAERHNSVCRLLNSQASSGSTRIFPLIARTNMPIPGFPATVDDIDRLTDPAINRILDLLGFPSDGDLKDKQRRLRVWCGIIYTRMELAPRE